MTTLSSLSEEGVAFIVKEQDKEIKLVAQLVVSLEDELKNCELISNYLLSVIKKLNINELKFEEFHEVRRIVDEHYIYVKKVTRKEGVGEKQTLFLRAQTLSIKLGGKVPVEWLLKEENRAFWLFIIRNYLHHDLFALRLQVPFDYADGPFIPVKLDELGLVWIPFNRMTIEHDLKESKMRYEFEGKFLFDSNLSYVLGNEYSCFYDGIQRYNIYLNTSWIPHEKRNPEEWGNRNLLEVWTVSNKDPKKPSMFTKTHAYIVLKDRQGYIRSVGQDALIDVKQYNLFEVLSRKSGYGKITTPDKYVFYPTNSRRFWHVKMEVSDQELAKVISIVEADKKNKAHSVSIMKKNCVSYTLKILREALDFDLDASMNGIHIFFKSLLPDHWYRKFMKRFIPWYERQSPTTQKLICFFPPFYIVSVATSIVAWMIAQNNYQGEKDYHLSDLILYPWRLQVDHPLALHRALERIADQKGVVDVKKARNEGAQEPNQLF